MNHAKLLDCTLRDGAYLVDKKFGDNAIHGIIRGLMNAKIDLIEIGFLQDDGFGEGKTVFRNAADAQRFVPKDKGNAEFTVLADYSRYSIDNLDNYTGDSIDAVRACFFKHERYDVIPFCKTIKEKGYKLFVQPVDILGYTDVELLDLIDKINEIEPYCFSIVDTFGSMYMDDLHRVYSLINHNLISTCKIGFHSHNNMQMSNALSQEFLNMNYGKREVVLDTTISGMGRGAGNTPTELVAQYMVSKLNYGYDIDALLDIIDDYMDNIRSRCAWGYSTHYFLAGSYSAHVNNIAYLKQKNSIRSKDIRYILNKIGAKACKRYDYDLLENTYYEYLQSDIDDSVAMQQLKEQLTGKNVLLLAPGSSIRTEADKIVAYKKDRETIVISVNFIPDIIDTDYIYMSNIKRYNYWKNSPLLKGVRKICTSNVADDISRDEIIVSFTRLVKCGWEHMDNSMILILRLLDELDVNSIAIAGMDGYEYQSETHKNYASQELERYNEYDNPLLLNQEIKEMLIDYMDTRRSSCPVRFITKSRFEEVMEKV